jgi:hypothetical protein
LHLSLQVNPAREELAREKVRARLREERERSGGSA